MERGARGFLGQFSVTVRAWSSPPGCQGDEKMVPAAAAERQQDEAGRNLAAFRGIAHPQPALRTICMTICFRPNCACSDNTQSRYPYAPGDSIGLVRRRRCEWTLGIEMAFREPDWLKSDSGRLTASSTSLPRYDRPSSTWSPPASSLRSLHPQAGIMNSMEQGEGHRPPQPTFSPPLACMIASSGGFTPSRALLKACA